MRCALCIEVGRTNDPAVCVGLNAMNVAIGPDFAAAGFCSHANDGCQSAGLGADFAAKALTESALHARAAAKSSLGKDGHRRGERVPAELASGTLENDAAGFHRQRSHRIGFRARWIEQAGAYETRDADFPFDFNVVQLQVRVGDRPINEGSTGNRPDFAALDEINFVKTPIIRSEMDAETAHHPAVNERKLT